MTDDTKTPRREQIEAVAEEYGCTLGFERDGCTQVILSPEHSKIALDVVLKFMQSFDGFTQLEIAAILTGLLSQWAGTSFDTPEVALEILGGVFHGASTSLAAATDMGLTRWSNRKVN